MKRGLLLAVVAAAFVVLWPHDHARAYVCAVPNVFKPNRNADANQMNANYSALVQCMRNLDATNVTGALFASNFIPTTIAQATFGGNRDYGFPGGLALLGLTAGGCASVDSTGTFTTATDGAGHAIACLPGGLIPIAQGGTGVAGGWATGMCFYDKAGVFGQRSCAPFGVGAVAPILLNATPPPTPTPGPTTAPTPQTAMVERMTTLTRVVNCPNAQAYSGGGCDPDLFPRLIWSQIIAYRFYQSFDGGNSWYFTNENDTTASDVETPTSGSGVPGPDCTQGAGVTYSYCPSGTWTPTAPPGTLGINFNAPYGAPGQTPPPATPSPVPTPSPTPTPIPTATPAWSAQYSLATPLAMQYGGTGVNGSGWSPSAPPFGDALGANATTGQVTWLPILPTIDTNGAACQGGAHPGTPYCVGIAPALYRWTGIPISLAGGSCAIVTTTTQAACSETDLVIPAYPIAGLATRLAPYLNLATLHASQVADGATHIYQLADTSGTTAVDTGSSPSNGSYPCIAGGACTLNASPLTTDQAAAVSFSNSVANAGAQLTFEDPPSTAHFTIEAVVKPVNNVNGGNGSNADIVANGSGAQLGFELQVQPSANAVGSTVGFIVRNTGGTNFGTGDPGFVNGNIYHVVGVFTGTALQYYVNGQLFGSIAFTGTYNPGGQPHMLIGTNPNGNSANRCGCVIEAVAIYGTALTAQQVFNHYQAAFAVPGAPLYASCAVSEEDAQFPMAYQAQWLGAPGAVALRVWNSTQHAMPGAYTATVGLACYGAWVPGF